LTIRVVFAAGATADVDDIARFGTERFGARGRTYVVELRAACKRLTDFPNIAPDFPGTRKPTRCLTHRSHRIFYRVEPDRILIVRILHHARAAPTGL
jgi:toxin ParE1/3/4